MAYTLQSIIMYAAFVVTKYDFSAGTASGSRVVNTAADSAITGLMFLVPPVMILISFFIFSSRYKIHGAYKREILDAVTRKKEELSANS